MNLIDDTWLPFTTKKGVEVLPIAEITRPDVLDFYLPRADFQGAAYQLVIGLLQTVFAPSNEEDWHELYETPPSVDELQKALSQASHAFNMLGDGPLFMQDYDALASSSTTPVANLLIEAPGGNTLKLNTDHFVKRQTSGGMSLPMAALALYTLQINAPSGGQGHRTGLRGGGPLTTLVLPASRDATLWQKVWMNVLWLKNTSQIDLSSPAIFPWLGPTKTSEGKNTMVLPGNDYPQEIQTYWAMPRRIRLNVEDAQDVCQVSGETCTPIIKNYQTQNYGNNYGDLWTHPLTPYAFNPKKPEQGKLSRKGQPEGLPYKMWHSLLFTEKSDKEHITPAQVVSSFYIKRDEFDKETNEIPRLWVFGYDMDNMKARCWYSSQIPLFKITPEQQDEILIEIQELQSLALDALKQCRAAVKNAWFKRPGDKKGDTSFIDRAFWQRTEQAFVEGLYAIQNSDEGFVLSSQQAKKWLEHIKNTIYQLFDEHVLTECHADRALARKMRARQSLRKWLNYSKAVKNFKHTYQISDERKAS
ncbi:MAG: type I-E CRISPR-associated protein Cse1/CasA [Pseudomonadota bacterium]